MEEEIWKDIDGYEGLYQVSDFGRIKSLKRAELNSNGVLRFYRGVILKQSTTRCGYSSVNIYKKGVMTTMLSHRIVAIHFIPNPENKPEVNHKNGIKADNRTENLEWCTKIENITHAIQTGLHSNKGEKHGRSKLTEREVIEIRNSIGTEKVIAEKYNISKSTIGDIRRNEKWKHLP